MLKGICFLLIFLPLTVLPAFATLNLTKGVSASGISSGGFMAAQLQVAFSSTIQSVGIFAAGPYGCSGGSLVTALYSCMKTTGHTPDGFALFENTRRLSDLKQIDDVQNLQTTRVFLVSGKYDETVETSVVKENISFYQAANVLPKNIKNRFDLPLGHAYPTVDFGNDCATSSAAPWMSRCGDDLTGEMMELFIGPLQPKMKARSESFYKVKQESAPSMANFAIAYVPAACKQGQPCHVHMSLHGCRQNVSEIGDTFYRKTGLNELAEANRFIVIYPQAVKDSWQGNPKGCWDWWGYTGSNYALKSGPQMRSLKNLLNDFLQNKVQLQKL